MSIGSIVKFPINTILEYATSAQLGICPQLCGTINELSLADRNGVPSEQAVREALDEIVGNIQYQNLGSGYGIYNSTLNGVAQYNTIAANGDDIISFLDAHTIYLSGCASTSIGPITDTSGITVQGGKYQYSTNVAASGIATSGTLLAPGQTDDVIGKIFLKCFTPFDNNGSSYSIGYDGDPARYITAFTAPSATGLFEDWIYGTAMMAEYDWLSADKDIKIYRNGSAGTNGELGISIFYDKVIWQPDYAYWMGTSSKSITRLNMSTDVPSTLSRDSFIRYDTEENYAIASNNYFVYVAGGLGSSNTPNYANINKYDSKNDTQYAVDIGSLTIARFGATCGKSVTKLYVCGGGYFDGLSNEHTSNQVDTLQFSNDVVTSTGLPLTIARRNGGSNIENITTLWIPGGDTLSGTMSTNTIEKLAFATNIVTTSTATLATAHHNGRYSSGWNTTNYGYILPGVNVNAGSFTDVNELTIFEQATETKTTISSFLPVSTRQGTSCQTDLHGYYYNLSYQNSTTEADQINVNILFRMDFATNTVETVMSSIAFIGNSTSV